ncbi:MAG TPA: aldehyde dehydrogenase family protein [Candidatus Acidoferrales bacterium]|nr:aldehyde dehydrogenase family protein [Candidatus Acidoferrales bacterium]
MRVYNLYIDGKFVEPKNGGYDVTLNPFDGSTIAKFAVAMGEDVNEAVRSARRAYESGVWSELSPEVRADYLKKISEKINDAANDLVELEVLDSGSTIKKAKEDIALSARAFNVFGKLGVMSYGSELAEISKPGLARNFLRYEPVGVVGAIIPWNFPLKMAAWKIGPALAAGCTVILKPSELTPVTAMELAKIIDEVGLPPGVVNIIPGYGAEAGEALVSHPDVNKIAFTGSTAVGKKIMQLAAENFKRLTLECGGKSANIVLDDADLEVAIDGSIYGMFYHSGQCCEAATRLYVHEKVYDDFVPALVERSKKMVIGNPIEPATDIGPLISKRQRDRVLDYIEGGKKNGFKVLLGGGMPSAPKLAGGNFVEPTIFADVDNKSKIAQEEIFGPVLVVNKFRTDDEAVELANDSSYGLAAGVWSKDIERAKAIAERLQAGTIWINEWHLLNERVPFGGYKQSGIGREFGRIGLEEYLEVKHIYVDDGVPREKRAWYDVVVPK